MEGEERDRMNDVLALLSSACACEYIENYTHEKNIAYYLIAHLAMCLIQNYS